MSGSWCPLKIRNSRGILEGMCIRNGLDVHEKNRVLEDNKEESVLVRGDELLPIDIDTVRSGGEVRRDMIRCHQDWLKRERERTKRLVEAEIRKKKNFFNAEERSEYLKAYKLSEGYKKSQEKWRRRRIIMRRMEALEEEKKQFWDLKHEYKDLKRELQDLKHFEKILPGVMSRLSKKLDDLDKKIGVQRKKYFLCVNARHQFELMQKYKQKKKDGAL